MDAPYYSQSTFAPAATMTFRHFSISLLMYAPNSSGVVGTGSAPWPIREFRTDGVFRISTMSR
jgi:hypothetical protein